MARRVRKMQMEQLTTLLGEYGIDAEEVPPALVAAAMQGLAFGVVQDQAAGYDTAADEAAAAMERLLVRLEAGGLDSVVDVPTDLQVRTDVQTFCSSAWTAADDDNRHRSGRYTGTRVHRVEDARLLQGHGTFVDDIVRPGMLHAVLRAQPVRTGPHRRASTRRTALALPGVHAVFTAADLNPDVHEQWYTSMGKDVPDTPRPPLAEGEVRFVGDPVALVVADRPLRRRGRRRLVDVDYEPAAAGRRLRRRRRRPSRSCTTAYPGNVAGSLGRPLSERLTAVFEASAHDVAETIFQQAYAPVPMETRGLVVEWSGERADDLGGDAGAPRGAARSSPACSACPSTRCG